jgi:hypothetical protein
LRMNQTPAPALSSRFRVCWWMRFGMALRLPSARAHCHLTLDELSDSGRR